MVLLNRQEKILFRLSPVFLMIVAISFAMLIGVLWEFFEFGMDCFFGMYMQKDTLISGFSSVSLDPTQGGKLTTVSPIESVSINNGEVIMDGDLDIGLYDTMEDLFVTFIGAVAFNLFAAARASVRFRVSKHIHFMMFSPPFHNWSGLCRDGFTWFLYNRLWAGRFAT